jgi:hypothetical protein
MTSAGTVTVVLIGSSFVWEAPKDSFGEGGPANPPSVGCPVRREA